MMSPRLKLLVLLLVPAVACGDGGIEPLAYENIAGSYYADTDAVFSGIALDVQFSITFAQNSNVLSGTWAQQWTDDGVEHVQETGTLNGVIAAGHNPSVVLTVTSALCTGTPRSFSGAYDVANLRLTITGRIDFHNSDSCLFAYSSKVVSIVLNH